MSAPRVVVDTNVLIASIGTASPYRWLFDALLEGRFTLCVSTPILLEYEDVFTRKTTAEIARNVLRLLLLLPNVEQVTPHFRWNLVQADPDDDKFVDCALSANADGIVTHDTHFDVLEALDFPRLNVLTAEELHRVLQEE